MNIERIIAGKWQRGVSIITVNNTVHPVYWNTVWSISFECQNYRFVCIKLAIHAFNLG